MKSSSVTEEPFYPALQGHPNWKPSSYDLAFLFLLLSLSPLFFFYVINSFINLTAPCLRGFHQLTGRILDRQRRLYCIHEGNISSSQCNSFTQYLI